MEYTASGHLIGMLDRDQRTARTTCASPKNCHPRLGQSMQTSASAPHGSVSVVASTRPHHHRRRASFGKHLRWTMQRLKNALAVITYLLIVIPNVLSAPNRTIMAAPHECNEETHFWMLQHAGCCSQGARDVSPDVKMWLADAVHTQARMNLNKANNSLDKYTQDKFNMSPDEVNSRYSASRSQFEWLPSANDIRKEYGEDVPDGVNNTMEHELVNLFEQFQKIAVGLEQIVLDHQNCAAADEDAKGICTNFRNMQADLRAILNELNTGIDHMGLARRPDVRCDIMPAHHRDMDETGRRIRDWIIYREYLNALEYTIAVFKRFKVAAAAAAAS